MSNRQRIWPLQGDDADKPSVWLLESGLTHAEVVRHGIYSTRERAEGALDRLQRSGKDHGNPAITQELIDSVDDF